MKQKETKKFTEIKDFRDSALIHPGDEKRFETPWEGETLKEMKTQFPDFHIWQDWENERWLAKKAGPNPNELSESIEFRGEDAIWFMNQLYPDWKEENRKVIYLIFEPPHGNFCWGNRDGSGGSDYLNTGGYSFLEWLKKMMEQKIDDEEL